MNTLAPGMAARFSPDRPLLDPREDKLGYRPFAEHLADAVMRMGPSEGFVVSLQGPWGSGKSTVLNFVRHRLESHHKDAVIVIPVDPWWFTGTEDLLRHFFQEFMAVVSARRVRFRKVTARLSELAASLSKVPLPYGEAAGAVSSTLALAAGKSKSIAAIKGEVGKAIGKTGKRLVVLVDNLDRLTAHELTQMFAVLKAVADFPQTTYLTAFDRAIVSRALDEVHPGGGADYLDKIVQVAFDLPDAAPADIFRLLTTKLAELPGRSDAVEFDEARWLQLSAKALTAFLKTPRSVQRLTNHIRRHSPSLRAR